MTQFECKFILVFLLILFNQWPQSWLEWIVSLLKLNSILSFHTHVTLNKVSTVSAPQMCQ